MSQQRKCCRTAKGSAPHEPSCPQAFVGSPLAARSGMVSHYGACAACGTPLGIEGGMAGTGLCGPCCLGEADSITEFGETW